MELDLHLVTEGDPDSGKALIHIAAASGALSIIKVCIHCIYMHDKNIPCSAKA